MNNTLEKYKIYKLSALTDNLQILLALLHWTLQHF